MTTLRSLDPHYRVFTKLFLGPTLTIYSIDKTAVAELRIFLEEFSSTTTLGGLTDVQKSSWLSTRSVS